MINNAEKMTENKNILQKKKKYNIFAKIIKHNKCNNKNIK